MILSTAIGSLRARADLSDHVVEPVRRICSLHLTLRMFAFLCLFIGRGVGVGVLVMDLFSQRDMVGMNGELCAICMSQAA